MHASRITLPAVVRHQPALAAWLADPGSLTRRIRSRCGQFAVLRVRENEAPALRPEMQLLGRQLPRARVREVLLLADGRPVVYARSLLPRTSLARAFRNLKGLGDRPLGEVLFTSQCRRGRVQVRQLANADPILRRMHHLLGRLPCRPWARTSEFLRAGQRVLVTEVFLQEIHKLG